MIEFEIKGQLYSKANSRQKTRWGGVIKSSKALAYVKDFNLQCPRLDPLIEDDVMVKAFVYYQSRRSDLDISLLLDCMQGFIYKNDRQVKEIHAFCNVDKINPRVFVTIDKILP